MNIPLDPTDKQDLEKLAESEGKDPGELLRELVHAAIVERNRDTMSSRDHDEVIRRQQEALRDLHIRLDALPLEGAQDGFSGRDHDEVLYGWKK